MKEEIRFDEQKKIDLLFVKSNIKTCNLEIQIESFIKHLIFISSQIKYNKNNDELKLLSKNQKKCLLKQTEYFIKKYEHLSQKNLLKKN